MAKLSDAVDLQLTRHLAGTLDLHKGGLAIFEQHKVRKSVEGAFLYLDHYVALVLVAFDDASLYDALQWVRVCHVCLRNKMR